MNTRIPALNALFFRIDELGACGIGQGTEYDFALACRVCGTGARQSSDLVVRGQDLPKNGKVSQCCFHHMLVRDDVRSSVLGSGVDPDSFRAVKINGRSTARWFQLWPSATLPPLHASTAGLERSQHKLGVTCPVCHRDGYFGSPQQPLKPVLAASSLVSMGYPSIECDKVIDVLETWECFGKSLPGNVVPPRVLATPRIVVSDRLATALHKCLSGEAELASITIV